MNTVQQLHQLGQSIWCDNIQRGLLVNGEFAGMIARGEIRGVTSNPTIFMNAMTKTSDYDAGLAPLAQAGHSAEQIFWQLAVEDIIAGADLLTPLYQQSNAGDGYISLEVSPYLAHDTESTISEARRLWKLINRPNLMIKIPATGVSLPAIRAAIADGINVNVTLIFSRERYAEVMEAYLQGLEQRVAAGLPVDRIASVASFFVSRVDSKVDGRLTEMINRADERADQAAQLLGKAAIANAKLAYADYKVVFGGERFQALRARGARVQRPLWASTSTKNPHYPDLMYVDTLVGPDTVNTVPPQTLHALLDHGVIRPNTVEEDLAGAEQALQALEQMGIAMRAVTQELEDEGVASFSQAFAEVVEQMEQRRQAVLQAS
ncbi:MAG TPA: transaldolase [Anaerolineae bacterium]|nr:transaldolase [Anaerolineae bacterium]HNU05397.1 transaldolase [Anaerolineae bacterium]